MRKSTEMAHNTSTTCACCGQDMRTAEFVIDTHRHWAKARGAVAKMSPQETDVLSYLRLSGVPRSLGEVALHVNGFTTNEDEIKKAKGVAKVVIWKLRQKLAPLGVKIETDAQRGYRLTVGAP